MAQVTSLKVGSSPTIINPSAALEVESSSKGVLLPRVALTGTTDVTTILSPTASMLVYNTATAGTAPNNVTPGYYYWSGAAWTRFTTGTPSADWTLTGNAGSVAGTNFMGTTDAVDFVTKTNNIERLRVTSAGNVGIGTTTPSNALHVSAASNPLKLTGLQTGNLGLDNVLTADATGVVRQVPFNASADQSLGSISAFAFSAVPSDYLECNGAAVSRTTYAALFAKIGTTFGAGDGSTTFNVPDLRGEFIRGWSNGRAGVDVGRTFGSFQADDFKNHSHSFSAPTSIAASAGSSGIILSSSGVTNWSTTSVGGSETRPRNVAMVYAIKAKESVLVPTATSTAVSTAAIANEPWYNVATNTAATANTQNIYQMGNVGIGTTTPTTKLEINNGATAGAIKIVDGTQGDGKVLTSDANGVGTWKTPGSKYYQSNTSTNTSSTVMNSNVFVKNNIFLTEAGTYLVSSVAHFANTSAGAAWFNVTYSNSNTTYTAVAATPAGIANLIPANSQGNITGMNIIQVSGPTTLYQWASCSGNSWTCYGNGIDGESTIIAIKLN